MRSKSLVDECEGCGRPNALYHAHRDEHLCPKCGNIYELGDLAHLHREQLLDPVLEVWREHWRATGINNQVLDEILEMYTDTDRSKHPLTYTYNLPKAKAARFPAYFLQAA